MPPGESISQPFKVPPAKETSRWLHTFWTEKRMLTWGGAYKSALGAAKSLIFTDVAKLLLDNGAMNEPLSPLSRRFSTFDEGTRQRIDITSKALRTGDLGPYQKNGTHCSGGNSKRRFRRVTEKA
jgi:hypothetical protein